MGSVGEGELGRWEKMDGGRVGGEERILVSVRLRPLNGIELSRSDPSDWECINTATIVYRNGLAERSSALPSAYTFDRVFGCECTTRQVYEDTAKEVALSVVSGINSSIFAYGQTSSGKTYTMTGITEYSVADIYDYIQKHEERDFVLKFSAMEIYNEAVRDLLSNDSSPLRLLDDPERGTVVDRLTEETLRDWDHLKELLSVCEAQRQIGETSLNEMSSRSHQILRLTIESSAREFLGKDSFSTLTASVNFVDLAGSERASQALSAGTRLKEGCHINRSLLTLGTVIRKLSKGRNGHVPYRDSKLTRILQSSLGGNARTAIICTMSPARSHLEQSRNTLLFATCAKEVVNSARVNVVMSDKVLVKHLQRELARLESELKYPSSASSTFVSDALKEKDSRIRKLEKEIKELIQQRDLAQSRLEDLLRAVGDDQGSREWDELSQYSASHVLNAYEDALSISDTSGVTYQTQDFGITGFDSSIRSQSCNGLQIRLSEAHKEEHATAAVTLSSSAQFNHRTDQIKGPKMILRGPFTDFEDLCKEVRCIEMEESKRTTSEDFNLFLTEESEFLVPVTIDSTEPGYQELKPDLKLGTTSVVEELVQNGISNGDLAKPYLDEPSPLQLVQKEEVQNVETNAIAAELHPDGSSPLTSMEEKSISRSLSLSKSRSCEAMLMTSLPAERSDKTPPTDDLKECMGRPERIQRRHMTLDYCNDVEKLQVGDSTEANASRKVFTKPNGATASEEDITSICKFVDGLKEMAQVQYQKDLADKQELETAIDHDFGLKKTVKDVGLDPVTNPSESPSRWPTDFEKRQRELIELWHACNVSLVHRTCFFLLFKGDPADSIYLEVEHRRLSFLKNTLSQGNLSRTAAEDGHKVTLASSMRNLQREREMLCRQMQKRLSSTEREGLYAKWGIALDSKRRRMQLAKLLWSDTKDMDNVKESASIVANLIGLMETGRALKETFGLSFTPQVRSRRSYSWINGLSSF